MFKLSRVPKKVPATTTSSRAPSTATTSHDAATKQPQHRPIGDDVVKKRRRGPPIPSSFLLLEEEIFKAERAFLEEEEEQDNRNVPTKKIEKEDPMESIVRKRKDNPVTTAESTKRRTSSHSKRNNHNNDNNDDDDDDDDDSDDSILELEIFTRKNHAMNSADSLSGRKIPFGIATKTKEPQNQQQQQQQQADDMRDILKKLPTTLSGRSDKENDRYCPSSRATTTTIAAAVDMIGADSTQSSTEVDEGVFSTSTVTSQTKMDQSISTTTATTNRSCAPSTPPSESSWSSSATIIASISEAVKSRIDTIMMTKPLNQISFREIRAQFTDREIDKHTLKVYVHNKMGLKTPRKKHKTKSKRGSSSSKVSQEINETTVRKPTDVCNNTSAMEPESETINGSTLARIPQQDTVQTLPNSADLTTTKTAAAPEYIKPLHPSICGVDLITKQTIQELVVPTTIPAKKRTRATRKRVTQKESEAVAIDNGVKSNAATKRKRDSVNKCCQLCSQCPCRLGKEYDDVVALNTSQSDQAVEKSLIKRLQKVQKVSERYANQEDNVRRQLKNHRRDMWRKRERLQEMARQNRAEDSAATASRFLPDVDEIEQYFHLGLSNKKESTTERDKARGRIFGPRKSYQPTLTQLMGGSSENHEEEEVNNEKLEGDVDIDSETTHMKYHPGISLGFPMEEASDEINADDLPEGEPVPVERIQWVDGKARGEDGEPVVAQSSTIWSCAVTGRPYSTWDRLFDDPASTENMGMDDLLELFDGAETGQTEPGCEKISTPQRVDMSMLTQRGYDQAQHIVQQISKNPCRLNVLKSVCPNWEENVCFAMYQRDKKEIANALAAVQKEKERLERGRAALEKLFHRHSTALSVFEETLSNSLTRLDSSQQDVAKMSRCAIDKKEVKPSHHQSLDLDHLDLENSQLLTQDEAEEAEEHSQDEEVVLNQSEPKGRTSHNTNFAGADPLVQLNRDSLTEERSPEQTSLNNLHVTGVVDWSVDRGNDIFWTNGRNSVDTDAATLIAGTSPHLSSTWTVGRRSIDTDAETLVCTTSPRRSSIAPCRLPSTPSKVLVLPGSNLFVSSQ